MAKSLFFFSSGVADGRSRSKARSLLESKLLVRKLRHGRRWSHEAWQIIKTKTKDTQTSETKARRRSPSQICVLPYEKQRSKQPTGPEPNQKNHKRFAKDTVVKTHCVALKDKNMQQTNYDTQKRETCDCVVASKTINSRVC